MPAKKTTKKTTKRKTTTVKKEPELTLDKAPVPEPVPEPVLEPVPEPVAPVTVNDTEVEPESSVVHFEKRLNQLSEHLNNLMKTIKDINNEVKDVKKELSRELKKKEKTKKRRATGNRPPSGFAKPTQLSDELCTFMGLEKGTMRARTQVTKFFCDYFKTHNLQDPTYKRNIVPNDALKKILKLKSGDEVSYFNLQKYLKIHYPSSN